MKHLTLPLAVAAALVAGQSQAATYVVQAKAERFDAALVSKIQANGGQVVANYPQIGVAIVESDSGFEARALRLAEIRYATPNMQLKYDVPEAMPLSNAEVMAAPPPNSGDDDRLFDTQWGMAAMKVQNAWAKGYRGAGAVVAVLDSGLDCNHPDLVANNLASLNTSFVPNETACQVPAFPTFNHGTHVAGIIAGADNAQGIIGVAPQAKFFAVKVLSAVTGSGDFAGIVQGVMYAADKGADVINMSLGVYGGLPVTRETRELIQAMQRAVLYARRHNTTVIAAAGNDGIDYDSATTPEGRRLMAFPAEVPGVIAVSATAPIGWATSPATINLDTPASYTNYGVSLIDVAAPGGDLGYTGTNTCTIAGLTRQCRVFDLVLSTTTGGWAWAGGTSMAAPHAAGLAALLIGAHGGELLPGRVENALQRGADDLGAPGKDPYYGHGRVNANASLR